ncbi:hypothetical protein C8R44DRAFT_725219 [Mycena epipterygia]|nr:hypothetical protein C8R44DRAFT_725219 [Mycena epipterygia]
MSIDSLWYFTRLVLLTLYRRRGGDNESIGAAGAGSRGREGVESGIAHHTSWAQERERAQGGEHQWHSTEDKDEGGMRARSGGRGMASARGQGRLVAGLIQARQEGWQRRSGGGRASVEGARLASAEWMRRESGVNSVRGAGKSNGWWEWRTHKGGPGSGCARGRCSKCRTTSKQRVRDPPTIDNSVTPPALAEHLQQAAMFNLAWSFQTSTPAVCFVDVGHKYLDSFEEQLLEH